MLKSSSIALIVAIAILSYLNINLDYSNCMKATKHSYISKEGADHISAICEAFIKEKVMVK
mgnify:FL=1|tara:strand:+ start:246 stop:428 length:183 start_codon:yes stop_codon:yes gene_type:complete